MELRPYQISAIEKTRQALREGIKRPLIYSPTGSGKTEISIEILRAAKERSARSAFICNRITLVEQASKRLEKSGLVHGIIQGQNTFGTKNKTLVCSIQTLARRGYPALDLAIIDEAHGATSEAYLNFIRAYPDTPIIGLSATPFTKGLGKEGVPFQTIVVAATIPELIEQRYLVDCEIYAPSGPDLTGVRVVRGDYDEKQLGDAVDRPALLGDIVEHWHQLAYGQQTVVFATNILHSKHICEEFISHNIPAEHLDCYTERRDREAILERFNSGITQVLCNVSVLAEGWDQPSASCMILARPTRSLTRYIQICGRILRPFGGKDLALILDHSSTSHLHGYPTDELPLELDEGKKPAASDPRPEEKLPKLCPRCHFLIPVGIYPCPKCGFAMQPQNKIEPAEGKLTKLERRQKFALEHKQEIWSGCLGLAESRGRARGWASHLYKDITGIWPSGVSDFSAPPTKIVLDMDTHNRIRFVKGKVRGVT